MSEQDRDIDHAQDLDDLTAELRRREMAYKFMAQQVAQHVERGTRLEAALKTAMIFIDQLLSDLRVAGGEPSKNLLMAKLKFDQTMRALMETASDATSYIDRGDSDAKTSA